MQANTQPDYIALAMMVAMLAIVAFLVLRKWLSEKNAAKKAATETTVTEPAAQPVAEAPGTGGQIKLNNVDPRTAAMVMAAVADQMGKPLNELRFISIREV